MFCVVAGVVGAMVGLVIAVLVNSALVEISVAKSFGLYFGALFLTILTGFGPEDQNATGAEPAVPFQTLT